MANHPLRIRVDGWTDSGSDSESSDSPCPIRKGKKLKLSLSKRKGKNMQPTRKILSVLRSMARQKSSRLKRGLFRRTQTAVPSGRSPTSWPGGKHATLPGTSLRVRNLKTFVSPAMPLCFANDLPSTLLRPERKMARNILLKPSPLALWSTSPHAFSECLLSKLFRHQQSEFCDVPQRAGQCFQRPPFERRGGASTSD